MSQLRYFPHRLISIYSKASFTHQEMYINIKPDELLKLFDHSLGLSWDMAHLGRSNNSAGATFIFCKAETDGLILAVCAHGNEELALVSVPCLPTNRERNTNMVMMGLKPDGLEGVKQQSRVLFKWQSTSVAFLSDQTCKDTCVGDGRIASRGQHILLYFFLCLNSHGIMALLVLPISLKHQSVELIISLCRHGTISKISWNIQTTFSRMHCDVMF